MFNCKKYVIFDLDGTIIDSVGMWNDIDRELITKLGEIPRKNIGEERHNFLATNSAGNIYENYACYLQTSYNLSCTSETVHNLRDELAIVYLKERMELKPQVDILLKKLKDSGYILALATIGSKWVLDIYINNNENIKNKIDFEQIFENNILTRESVTNKKPHPEMYLKVLEILNARPEECIVIEDSLSGVMAAKRANIEAINIYDKYSDCDRDKINELADYFVKDYNELISILDNNKTRD